MIYNFLLTSNQSGTSGTSYEMELICNIYCGVQSITGYEEYNWNNIRSDAKNNVQFLGVRHLWSSQEMTNFVNPPTHSIHKTEH